MADIIRTEGGEPSGSGAMGIIIGVLIVLVLLVGGWWLFVRQPVASAPDTTIIEQPANTPVEGDTTIEGDTNVIVPGTSGDQTTTP